MKLNKVLILSALPLLREALKRHTVSVRMDFVNYDDAAKCVGRRIGIATGMTADMVEPLVTAVTIFGECSARSVTGLARVNISVYGADIEFRKNICALCWNNAVVSAMNSSDDDDFRESLKLLIIEEGVNNHG